jgi:hypothetical protein
MGNVNTTHGNILTLIAFMKIALVKKHTSERTELKFMQIIGSKFGSASTPKNTKVRIIRCDIGNEFDRCSVYEMSGS